MAIKLLAVLLVLVLAHGFPDLARWRDQDRLRVWLTLFHQVGGAAQTVFAIALPVLICALMQWAFSGWMLGLLAFAFAVCVLWICWGPRDLSRDIDAVIKAPDSERRRAVAQDLRPEGDEMALPFEAHALVDAAFRSALQRWFGVLFWFLLLGPTGALVYRLAQQLAHSSSLAIAQPVDGRVLAQRLAALLDWIPAHLMVLALAIASDFDAIVHAWREYHERRQGYFTLDLGFLSAIARAGVDADVIAGDGYTEDVDDPLVELIDARALMLRVLIVWLAVAALFALGGWFA